MNGRRELSWVKVRSKSGLGPGPDELAAFTSLEPPRFERHTIFGVDLGRDVK